MRGVSAIFHVHTLTMIDCLAQAVLLSTLLYAGMSGVRHTVRTSGLYPGEGDRPNVPIGESSNKTSGTVSDRKTIARIF